eukprot:359726-Chlamydomonas_euryale.AAC.1
MDENGRRTQGYSGVALGRPKPRAKRQAGREAPVAPPVAFPRRRGQRARCPALQLLLALSMV